MKKTKKIITVFLLIIAFINNFAQSKSFTNQIKFINSNYPHDKLEFYCEKDPITNEEEKIFTLNFSNSNTSIINLELTENKEVFAYYGKNKLITFLDKNNKQTIKLPIYKEKNIQDERNPFFKEEDILLFDVNQKGIFLKMMKQHELINEIIDSLEQTKNKKIYINNFKEKYKITTDEDFINKYFDYNLKKIELYYGLLSSDSVRNYIANDEINLKNPAYASLFNCIFYYYIFEDLEKNENLQKAFFSKNFKNTITIIDTLNKIKLYPKLSELILIKFLHDANYKAFLGREFINTFLDKIITESKFILSQEIAKNVKEKINYLQTDSEAIELKLQKIEDENSTIVLNKNYTDKYIYLNFFTAYRPKAQQDLILLKEISEKYEKNLEVISIICDSNFKIIPDSITEKLQIYNLLSKKKVIKDYRVKVYPSYFLLDKNFRIVQSPCKEPNEGFIKSFSKLIYNDYLKKIRK